MNKTRMMNREKERTVTLNYNQLAAGLQGEKSSLQDVVKNRCDCVCGHLRADVLLLTASAAYLLSE